MTLERMPLVGREVFYFPDKDIDPPHNNAAILPAVIVRVWSAEPGKELVNLKVTNDGQDDFWRTSRKRGIKPGHWEWEVNIDLHELSK